jgi:hypothetical protein
MLPIHCWKTAMALAGKCDTVCLFKALSACYSRMYGQDTFVYRIRNGKSWVKKGKETDVNQINL